MFTGIVTELGRVGAISSGEDGAEITVRSEHVGEQLGIGDSVSINGCCLTVVEKVADGFRVTAVPETLRLTNLGQLDSGDGVNLEPAARLSDFLGGHLVQGHVDGTGRVESVHEEGNSRVFRFSAPASVLRYCVQKGSITVNGVSLTISGLGADYFEVAIIPHTMEVTNFSTLVPGSRVNLEADVISKYVESHVRKALGWMLVCILSLGQLMGAGLRIDTGTVVILEHETQSSSSEFVIRVARFRPDIVLEWESTTDQGTLHLFQRAVRETDKFTLSQLFEVGVDLESRDVMSIWLSDRLFQEVADGPGTKLKVVFNKLPLKMTVKGEEEVSVLVDGEEEILPAIRIEDHRQGEWLILKNQDSPLVLEYKSKYYRQTVKRVSHSGASKLRWIQKLPPVK